MPAAIPALAGVIVGAQGAAALVGAGLIAGATATAIATGIIGGLVSFGLSKLMGLDKPEQQRAPGPEINIRGATTPIPIIYGRRKIACSFVQLVATGSVRDRPLGGIFGDQSRYTFSNEYLNVVGGWG
jgi:hypothetical protein